MPKTPAPSEPSRNPFAGKTFAITGTLEKRSKDEAAMSIEVRGGKVTGTVSRKTDYLVAGDRAGAKLEAAGRSPTHSATRTSAEPPHAVASLSSRIAPENWKVTVLPLPKGFTLARALCFGGGGILGVAEARRRPARRCLWAEGRAEPIDDPAGFEPWGGGATQLAGRRMVDGKDRATVCERSGGRWALVDLHPPGYTSSVATACADGQQVGYGQPGGQAGNPVERALLWTGAAKGVVELRGPDPARQT